MKTACLIKVKKKPTKVKSWVFSVTRCNTYRKNVNFLRCRFPVWLHSEKFLNELGSIKQPV